MLSTDVIKEKEDCASMLSPNAQTIKAIIKLIYLNTRLDKKRRYKPGKKELAKLSNYCQKSQLKVDQTMKEII